jgi:hypothetical protein
LSNSGAKTFFKYGCFGCAGLVGLGIVLLALLSGTALFQSRVAEVESRELLQEFPRVETASEVEVPAEAETELAIDGPDPGLIVLDFASGEFAVEAAKPGEPLRVEATFDSKSYELDEQRTEGDAGWTYRLIFRQTRTFNLGGLRRLFGGRPPKVTVFLPRDVPFALDATLEDGPSEVDLGGLWLTESDLTFRKGALMLDVSEPLAVPAESFTVNGKMGACIAKKLGNTSARELTLHHGMGALVADLTGEWLNDATVDIQLAMGGGQVRLPRGVNIRGLSDPFAQHNVESDSDNPRPTLDMTVHFDMGDLQISE